MVDYQNDVFLPHMKALEMRIEEYLGDQMEIITQPNLAVDEK